MYFESNRSSAEGMLAVGTVVMNRVNDRNFPHSVCAVVGQPNQFAPGLLWMPLHEGSSLQLARAMAEKVLGGYRHPGVGGAEFFHTAGYTFPYDNMHYVLVAGGNAFYWRS
jgi:spore germination cell wall hydrolase CwlJ-like protein